MARQTACQDSAVGVKAVKTGWVAPVAMLCLLGFMVPPSAFAAGSAKAGAKATSSKQNLNKQDKKWMANAHQINLAEMKMARLAEHRAHANSLIKVAQTIARDHAMLDAKGAKLAGKLGLSLPNAPSVKQKAVFSLVSSKQNMAFDPEWVHQEIDAHIAAIEKTKREIHKGSSKQVVQLAKQALPVLKKHRHLLRLAANRMNGGK